MLNISTWEEKKTKWSVNMWPNTFCCIDTMEAVHLSAEVTSEGTRSCSQPSSEYQTTQTWHHHHVVSKVRLRLKFLFYMCFFFSLHRYAHTKCNHNLYRSNIKQKLVNIRLIADRSFWPWTVQTWRVRSASLNESWGIYATCGCELRQQYLYKTLKRYFTGRVWLGLCLRTLLAFWEHVIRVIFCWRCFGAPSSFWKYFQRVSSFKILVNYFFACKWR